MLWYRITDFLKTRTGHLFLFGLAVVALFLMATKFFKKKEKSQELVASQFPYLSEDGEWVAGKDSAASHSSSADQYQHAILNDDYTPFTPPVPVRKTVPPPKTDPEPIEVPEEREVFVSLPPLIKYQGKATRSQPEDRVERQTEPIEEPPVAPTPPTLNLRPGRLLYAELRAPLSSELTDGVVTARLTRPLLRAGKMIAPKGATLIGSIQQTAQGRLFLAPDWQLRRADGVNVPLRGEAQECSIDPKTGKYTLNDGRAGLPGLLPPRGNRINSLWARTLRILTVVGGRLAQDRVRTAVGDYVPGTARNAVLEGVVQIAGQGWPSSVSRSPEAAPVIIEAGRRFYLSILP